MYVWFLHFQRSTHPGRWGHGLASSRRHPQPDNQLATTTVQTVPSGPEHCLLTPISRLHRSSQCFTEQTHVTVTLQIHIRDVLGSIPRSVTLVKSLQMNPGVIPLNRQRPALSKLLLTRHLS